MATSDLPAATGDWLGRLPEAQRLAAQAATDARLIGWIGASLAFLAAAAIVARFDLLGALTRRLEADRPRPWLASAAAAGALALILALVKAGADAVTAWRVDAILAAGGGVMPDAGLAAYLAAAMAGVAPSVGAAVILVPPLAWLVRRRPRSWALIVGAAAVALILALGWLPYVFSAAPVDGAAPPGPVRDSVAQLVAQSGLPATGVWLDSDPGFDADVTGGFGHARVVVGPKLMSWTLAEARAFVGHLMGHYVHNDILLACLAAGAAMLAGLLAAQRFAAPLARRLGARTASRAADPEALPALAMIGWATLTLAWLAAAAYLRWANFGADAYSLDHAHEPDGLAAVIERDWNHDAVAPSPFETVIFYSHPPLRDRIAHAMAWKAAHGG